jgi:molybdate transport system substrate-binding protein
MSISKLFKSLIAINLLLLSTALQAEEKITVFAAASLTNALSELAADYEKTAKVSIQTSFASSGTLAKQIEKGAPADIFVSADTKWMSYLQDKNLIQNDSKVNLLENELVLIAPKGKAFKVVQDKSFSFDKAFQGKLCTGEVESVPVGIYAKQALTNLNWWESIKPRLVGAQDVRSALVLVERAECDAGIVYATDAKVSNKVEVISVFAESTHEPIVYPLVIVKNANANAKGFYDYLKSDKAQQVFVRYGFVKSKQ